MRYRIVEIDVEEEVGYLHPDVFKTKKAAKAKAKGLKKELGEDYYHICVVEEGGQDEQE